MTRKKTRERAARRPQRNYYAEYCPYGTNTISDRNTLLQFESREERDEYVDRCNAESGYRGKFFAEAVTRREAERRYRVADFWDADRSREVYGERTCRDKVFFEIGTR